jgi:hypothetical protein
MRRRCHPLWHRPGVEKVEPGRYRLQQAKARRGRKRGPPDMTDDDLCLAQQGGKLRRVALIVEDRRLQWRLVFGHEPAIAEYVIMTMLALTHRLTLARIRGATPAAKWPRNRAFIQCFPHRTGDRCAIVDATVRNGKEFGGRNDEAAGEDAARGRAQWRRYLNLVADRAPDRDLSEPETSSDALLDELVRALARQAAERDYADLRNKSLRARRLTGGKKDPK